MHRPVALGLLLVVLLHGCSSESLQRPQWGALEEERFNRRALTQAADDYEEGSVAADSSALPQACRVTSGRTRSCYGTCLTCQNTPGAAARRQCLCCKAGYVPTDNPARCQRCPIGTVAGPGQTECAPCPTGFSTLSPGSRRCTGESFICASVGWIPGGYALQGGSYCGTLVTSHPAQFLHTSAFAT